MRLVLHKTQHPVLAYRKCVDATCCPCQFQDAFEDDE